MSDPKVEYEFRNYKVTIDALVTAPSEQEARDALERSGLIVGALIGETLIEDVVVVT